MTMPALSLTGIRWPVLAKNVGLTALIGTCIALALEADHTRGLPVLVAFALWFTHIFFIGCLFLACMALTLRLRFTYRVALLTTIALVPFLFAPFSLVLDFGFGNPDDGELTWVNLPGLYIDEILSIAPVSVVSALILAFITYREMLPGQAAETRSVSHTPEKSEPVPPRLCDLFSGVPADLGDEIIRMSAQDHYVEIVTTKGRALITEKFSDCVAKLAHLSGLQCHRSHWINLSCIQCVERSGSVYDCVMSNGDRVPVSRRRWPDLKKQREAGKVIARSRAHSTSIVSAR